MYGSGEPCLASLLGLSYPQIADLGDKCEAQAGLDTTLTGYYISGGVGIAYFNMAT